MLGITTEIIVHPAAAVAMVHALELKLESASLALWLTETVQPILQRETADNFVKEAAPNGSEWAPLAPSTIETRLNEGFATGPIQYRTGAMYDYFDQAAGNISATQIGTSLSWPGDKMSGNLKYKVGSAQYGNKRTGAPARPILGLNVHDSAEILESLFSYVVGVRL